jgi:hypothetical protein
MFFQPYLPNQRILHAITNVTTWQMLATDGVGYATYAALVAAAKTPWPGLDPGCDLQQLTYRSEDGSAAAGSAFYIAFNRTTAPTDDQAELVTTPDLPPVPGPIRNVWIRKTAGTDEVILAGRY